MEDYKKITVAAYDQNAGFFDQKHRQLAKNLLSQADKFISYLPGRQILDIGCGAGYVSSYFAKQGMNVTCVDLSEKMIELCREKGLNARVMDIEKLEFGRESSDGIWSVTSLLHIQKAEIPKVLDRIYEILMKKGILYVALKEGEGERLIRDDVPEERFFAYWKDEEFLDAAKKFQLIEKNKIFTGHTTFLEFFLKKA